jgi:hypothetical protein
MNVLRCSLPLLLAALASAAAAQPGVDREAMWFAPTAEDWKKPVLITFQRTWEDALAVAKETGKAILICVNMDGEIASEHYAGVRYRQPDIAALYEPYVCVVASVYRHTPRDHDEHGQRILCPRFGSVTCGEHIAIEPVLYEQFFDGRRIAPRHIMVELDGSETYDVFYAMDTASVFGAIRDGIADRAAQPPPVVRGDRPLVERVASRDVEDRTAVETAFRDGDRELRQALLAAANEHIDAAPVDLLRLAVFGFDADLARAARAALAKASSGEAVDVINEALRAQLDGGEREALVAALERLGASSTRARSLAVVHKGLGTRSDQVDVDGWSKALSGGGTYAAPIDWSALESRVDSRAAAAQSRPDDAAAQLELAESSLRLAVDPQTSQILAADRRTASKYAKLMFEDARRAGLEAERLGAKGWRVQAVLALAAWYLGDTSEAHRRAIAAMPEIPPGAEEWSAIGTVALFAQARRSAILQAMREKQEWPGQWLTDVNAAYSVLARHPLGTDAHVAAHYDLLRVLGAGGRAARVLDEGLARFPGSAELHDCLRQRVLAERGAAGLEPTYAAMLEKPDAPPALEWFAGYAAIVAAEFDRRANRDRDARAAYDRAIAHYERFIAGNQDARDSADHFVAIALAGRARLALENDDAPAALDELLASLQRRPQSAATLDGLNISPADTARMLRARLTRLERADLLQRLEAALAQLDPELLQLPAYERADRGPPGRPNRRGR